MPAPVSTPRSQFTALWLKQWRLTRRSYITCAWNIVLPVLVLAAVLALDKWLNSRLSESVPRMEYPPISPPWYLYQADGNKTTFVPPATFIYAAAPQVNSSDLGSYDLAGTGVLNTIYPREAWVKFVEFSELNGEIQPKEILNRERNFSFQGLPASTEQELLATLYDGYSGDRPPAYVSAYSVSELDFTNRRFAFDVFVNGSLSLYSDLASAAALLDEGISALLNASVPGVMRFLGYKFFPFKGGKVNQVDIATAAGPFFYLILLSMLFPVFVNLIVYEKENRLTVLMKMNGLRMSLWWAVNYVFCFALYLAVMIFFLIAGAALRFRFFTQSSPGVLVVLLILWGFANVSFSFAVSTLFSRARVATITCYFWIILTALIANFLIDNWVRDIEGKQALANVVSLVPAWALYRAMVYIAMQTQNQGPGVSWSDVSDSKMNIAACYGYLILAGILWFLLALYLEEVLPQEFGVQRHPLFFLKRAYWFGDDDNAVPRPAYEPVSSDPTTVATERERTFNSEQQASVRVLGLRKEYGSKVAVSNVALSIEPGVCLGLLGSNGAGKTTLISMLCGLFPPTTGDALIDGLSIRTSMTEIHRRIGVCPQMNVLWDDLTGAEHLYFFGRLKGLTGKSLKEAVRTSLEGVRLWPARNKLSKKYSGGMKRRLAVAISLIGDPKVVFLDEPSTGLDPASRETLWECIRAAKVGKAMVLTTHSMEEAEVLCDKHAVFCDGSLRALGLAAELKAIYAPSLRLSLNLKRESAQRFEVLDKFVYAQFPAARPDSSKAVAEFRTFMLPPSARLSDIFGAVDSSRDVLGIADWAVSNATLEEVFFAVVRLARLADLRKPNGTWNPDDVCMALAQHSSAPRIAAPNGFSPDVWGLALAAAYFTAQPEVEQSDWRQLSTQLNDALRANNVDPAAVTQARAALQETGLLFQG